MKLKGFFAAAAAAAVMAATAVTCFAVNDGEATYCFDTMNNISDWQTYGSANEAGLKLSHTIQKSKNGEGSMIVSENVTDKISDTYGGAFITADAVGLNDFGGYMITMSVLLSENAENNHENFYLYSDGIIWIQSSPEELIAGKWIDISLQIPEDAANTRVGFTIPTYEIYSGDVLYIDDFCISDAEGNIISNVGDYKAKTIAATNTVPQWVNIILIVVLVILIVGIIAGIGVLVSLNVKKFH